MKNIEEFENKIGYHFQDRELLGKALTHSSYANEQRKLGDNNERLEFLGDAVLEMVSSTCLFLDNPDMHEGEMTKLRASLVCEPTLASIAREISVDKYIFLGKGEENTGGRERDSIVSDAFEAIIGAIFLDGGLDAAKQFIVKFVMTDIENKKLFHDSKTILQEIVQKDYKEPLRYVLIEESGPDHNKIFTTAALLSEKEIGRGTGRTKKAAEQKAAYEAILKLKSETKK